MIFLSPGVKTNEVDFSTYVGQTSSCIVGIVGGGRKGPTGVATLCTSPANFVEQFGEPLVTDFGAQAAIQFLQQGNQLYYVREAENTAQKSTGTLCNGAVTITAKEIGTYFDRFTVAIADVKTDGTFKLTVSKDNIPVEAFTASLDPTSENFIESLDSSWLTFELLEGEEGAEAPVATAGSVVLSGGNDGLPLTAETVVGTGTSGLQAFTNVDSIDVNLIAAPGYWEDIVVTELLSICKNRSDCFAIIDPPQSLSVQDVIAYHNGELSGDGYPTAALNTSYGGLFYPWVQIYDRYSGEKIWCPPSGVVLAQFAYNDSVGQPWFAPAGLNRGMLTTVLATERELSAGDRDALYGNGNAVNTIVNYKRQGFTIWGQRTLQRKSSALDRINVRRLLNMVRKAISISSAYMVFEQNDPLTWRQWKGTVDPYLESIKNSRGLYDYLTIMDETTVTAAHQDRNEMPGQVFLKPTKSAEFIPIDFILTSSGAVFGEDE